MPDNFVTLFLACALGVALSIAIPALRKAIGINTTSTAGPWDTIRPYVAWALLSFALSLVIVITTTLTDFQSAFIAGYLSDSTVQKIKPIG